jgi:hypothetical protein
MLLGHGWGRREGHSAEREMQGARLDDNGVEPIISKSCASQEAVSASPALRSAWRRMGTARKWKVSAASVALHVGRRWCWVVLID